MSVNITAMSRRSLLVAIGENLQLPQMTDVREERKVVTAVFADIVGSTALGERVDPVDV
jgi:class 3 adenylate cyclase